MAGTRPRASVDELARERLVALLHALMRGSNGVQRGALTETLRAYYRPADAPETDPEDIRARTGTGDGHDALLEDIRTLQRMGLEVKNAGSEQEQIWVTKADGLVALPPSLTPSEEAVIVTALQIFRDGVQPASVSTAHKLRIDDATPRPWRVDTGLDQESWHAFYECRAARRFVHLEHQSGSSMETIVAQPWAIVEAGGRYAAIVRPVRGQTRLLWVDEVRSPVRPATQAEHQAKNEIGSWEPDPDEIRDLVRDATPHAVSASGTTRDGARASVTAHDEATLPARALRHDVLLDDPQLRLNQRELLNDLIRMHS